MNKFMFQRGGTDKVRSLKFIEKYIFLDLPDPSASWSFCYACLKFITYRSGTESKFWGGKTDDHIELTSKKKPCLKNDNDLDETQRVSLTKLEKYKWNSYWLLELIKNIKQKNWTMDCKRF